MDYLKNFFSECRFAVNEISAALGSNKSPEEKGAICGEMALVIVCDLSASDFIKANPTLFNNRQNFVNLVDNINALYASFENFKDAILSKSCKVNEIALAAAEVIKHDELYYSSEVIE